jgi:ubiquinone/menaquinone biosynthesis C-methylase UbiE
MINLDHLLDDVIIPQDAFTEIEVKFKNTKLYNTLLQILREFYNETVEESIVYYYDNNIRKIVTNGKSVVEQKIRLKDVYDYSQQYGFVVSVSTETQIKNTRLGREKFVRKRTRHSFKLDDNYQVDMTEVIEKGKTKYEIELEYINKLDFFNTNDLINHILFIYKILTNTVNSLQLITITDIDNLNYSINTILNEDTRKNFINNNIFTKARNIKYQDIVYGGVVGNKINYYVAHKADGLFKMLVLNPVGLWLVYGSDYNLLQRVTGIIDTSVFICEALYNDHNNPYLLLVYDCIIINNQDIRLQNLDQRIQNINNILLYSNDMIKIEEKPSYVLTLDNFFDVMNMLFKQQDELTWPQDGFIFTPNTIYNPHSDQQPLNKRLLINYPDVCKWKPSSKITIDFRVLLTNNHVVFLYVYDRYKKQEVPFIGNINKLTSDMISQDFYNNINLYNNMIVECAYDPICKVLTPVKIRYDKLGPNNLDIALSNWTDLHDPITDEDLKGNTIEFVKKYHNNIKNILYGLPTIYKPIDSLNIKNNYTLLDIGGGQGGDINKWKRSNAQKIYTVEPNNKNLNELRARLANTNYQNSVVPINTVGEDTDTITKMINKPVDMISLMLSLSFFFSDDSHLDALVHTISNNLAMNGYITFLTIDGQKLKPHLPLLLNDVSFTLYQNKFVRTEITGIVGKQWEFLVDLKLLTTKLLNVGIQLVTMRDATDELLLSPEAKLYTSLFTYGVYQRVNNVNIVYNNNVLTPIIYPKIQTITLDRIDDDELAPIANTISHQIFRLGCVNSLYHCVLKAMYPPYQETNDAKLRYKMVEDLKKELNTNDLTIIGNQLDIDIYLFNYVNNDLVLKEYTFDCQQPNRYAILILHHNDSYELLTIKQNDYIKTQFEYDDTLLITIKKLTITNVNMIYVNSLIKNIKKMYQLPKDNKNLIKQITNLFTSQNKEEDLKLILNNYKKLTKREDTNRVNERVNTITSILNQLQFVPTSVLDIGAADAKITIGLKNYYQLDTTNVYAIDQKLAKTDAVTALVYTDDGKIKLADASVNLVILFAVLHHIPPDIRNNLMIEIERVLQPGGLVIIREHDDNNQEDFYQFIDLIHLFWYIASNETNDPLYMLSKIQFEELFNNINLQPIYEQRYDEPNPQRLYHEVFIKPQQVVTSAFNQTTFVDDFPYKRLSMDIKDVDKRFNNLKSYQFTFVNMPYTIRNIPGNFYKNKKLKYHDILIRNEVSDYLNYNLISDYFMDECRMQAKRYDQALTPFEYWNQNKNAVIAYAKKHYGQANAYTLREAIYKLAGEVTEFRATLMVGFIKMFKATKILDISSGFGSRLIGSMVMDVTYVGVDPNTCLMPHYQEMIQHFAIDPNKYIMIQSPFETAVLPDMTFDLILTSTPYAWLEHYSDETTQSTFNKNLDEWFDEFLMASLIKAWKVLESKGYMVIIINDIYNVAHYTEKMVQIFTKITKDATFLGVISYSEFVDNKPRSAQPSWVWIKA